MCIMALLVGVCAAGAGETITPEIARWFAPQEWERDTDDPILSLAEAPSFGDTHILAPCVAFEQEQYALWYSGSSGSVGERIFRMGRATSRDGRQFARFEANPVFEFGDGRRSILTPAILRRPDGAVLREEGLLRIWFSAADLTEEAGEHTLHESTSADGIRWAPPFRNKYFALNTARWAGPGGGAGPVDDGARRAQLRAPLAKMLGLPRARVPLAPESRGQIRREGIVIEEWVFTSEPGSRVPAVLYRPEEPPGALPAIVLTLGHGGSKSHPSYMYLGQLYARMGFACLRPEEIGRPEYTIEGWLEAIESEPRQSVDVEKQ